MTPAERLADLRARIRYHEERGAEWLEILLTESDRLELRLRPSFSLTGRLRPNA